MVPIVHGSPVVYLHITEAVDQTTLSHLLLMASQIALHVERIQAHLFHVLMDLNQIFYAKLRNIREFTINSVEDIVDIQTLEQIAQNQL